MRSRLPSVLAAILAALNCAQAALAQSEAELDAAYYVLEGLQEVSFEENREYCGFLSITDDGQFIATDALQGETDSCRPLFPRGDGVVIASFHTHAAHDPGAYSEVPSVKDVLADMDDGVDGYVATPGGRFWFIDGVNGVVEQICGPGCLPQDPFYNPYEVGPVEERYTLEELEWREQQ